MITLLLVICSSLHHSINAQSASQIQLKLISDALSSYALRDAAVAYKLVDPDIKVTVSDGLSLPNMQSIVRGDVDAAMTALSIPATLSASAPQLYSLPLLAAALVPCYRIDDAGTSISLILSRRNLAMIYMGDIINWNSSLIAADNPSLVLPNLPITVILESVPSANTELLLVALRKFNTTAIFRIPRNSTGPIWPLSRYAKYRFATGTTGLGGLLLSTDGAITVIAQSYAEVLKISTARMINKAGQTVEASPTSISFAAVELGTSRKLDDPNIADLTDCSAASGWPIAGFSYIMVL